ncbi:MAG: hypothetical protein MUF69_14790, partial [Desulfobacterota bacterium]|nr:hypothetical protein [Thermodesulfobacteriota bacterium]
MERFRIFPALTIFILACGSLFILETVYHSPTQAAREIFRKQNEGYTGSRSCRECHEKFYQLWAPSHHGLAMQPYTAEFARKELQSQEKPIVIGRVGYRAVVDPGKGYVLEQGPKGKKTYPIAHVLGGKNVYY